MLKKHNDIFSSGVKGFFLCPHFDSRVASINGIHLFYLCLEAGFRFGLGHVCLVHSDDEKYLPSVAISFA